MAQGLVTHSYLEDIADAIREKLGTQDTYTPSQMANAVMQIPTGGVEIVPWATGTDEQIVAMLQAAHNGDIDLQTDGGWAVGDVRTISVGSFTDGAGTTHAQQDIDIVITSFDDYENCGCLMQFDFKDCLINGIRMNSSATSSGGYGASELKNVSIPALVNALPTWMKDNLIEFSCVVCNSYQTPTIVTGNKLALRSETEIFGSKTKSQGGEGTQLSYYSDSLNRRKKRGHSGSANSWWERSVRTSGDGFCRLLADGSAADIYSQSAEGIAPFGCL